jgi:hypothetical protein
MCESSLYLNPSVVACDRFLDLPQLFDQGLLATYANGAVPAVVISADVVNPRFWRAYKQKGASVGEPSLVVHDRQSSKEILIRGGLQ